MAFSVRTSLIMALWRILFADGKQAKPKFDDGKIPIISLLVAWTVELYLLSVSLS